MHFILARAVMALPDFPMSLRAFVIVFVVSVTSTWARLGETEKELVTRFGPPTSRGKHAMTAQGKYWELGPVLNFKQDDWRIVSDLVDDRVVQEHYSKSGLWTLEQIQAVLAANSQGATWTETTKGAGNYVRMWKRSDGATAQWANGIDLTTPAYTRAKELVEAKARAGARRTPKI